MQDEVGGPSRPQVSVRVVSGVLLSALLAGLIAWVVLQRGPENPSGAGSQAIGSTEWPLPVDTQAMVEAAGLTLGPMGMAEHYHPQLTIVADGRRIAVPAGIGMDPVAGAMSALHTHTADGMLHVEASAPGQRFTLGQLFQQWAVHLSDTRLGDLDVQRVMATVNGQPFDGDPASIVLAPEQEIALEAQ